MSTTPRALGRAKALTAGAMLVAAVATGGVAQHLADAQATTAAAGAASTGDSGTSPATSSDNGAATLAGTSSDDDDSSSSDDDSSSSSSSSSGTSGATSNGFSAPAPVAPAQAPAQSSTNGS